MRKDSRQWFVSITLQHKEHHARKLSPSYFIKWNHLLFHLTIWKPHITLSATYPSPVENSWQVIACSQWKYCHWGWGCDFLFVKFRKDPTSLQNTQPFQPKMCQLDSYGFFHFHKLIYSLTSYKTCKKVRRWPLVIKTSNFRTMPPPAFVYTHAFGASREGPRNSGFLTRYLLTDRGVAYDNMWKADTSQGCWNP